MVIRFQGPEVDVDEGLKIKEDEEGNENEEEPN